MEKNDLVAGYKSFISKCKTERECARYICEDAKNRGYKSLLECDHLSAGDRVYYNMMGKSVILFKIGSAPLESGMNILGAHIDSPRLDAKQNPIFERDGIVYMNTHYYGGIKKYQWLTTPLALHGVICKKDGTTINVNIGEEENDPVFYISDILVHLASEQLEKTAGKFIDGEQLDLIVGYSIPEKKSHTKESCDNNSSDKDKNKDKAKKAVLKLLKDKYGVDEEDLESAELEAVPAGAARDLGFDSTLIAGYGHDDRSCAYPSYIAMMEAAESGNGKTNCLICVDKEEIGSVGATGMASNLFENVTAEVVARLGEYSELTLRRALQNSSMLSSDVNAAYDPAFSDLFDKDNASVLGGGLVFNKYTGSRGKSGANDAPAEYIAAIRAILDAKDVHYQMAELGKVDKGGGGTIAYLAAKYGMRVIDAGVPVLSMHSPCEVIAKEDLYQAYLGYKAFLEQ